MFGSCVGMMNVSTIEPWITQLLLSNASRCRPFPQFVSQFKHGDCWHDSSSNQLLSFTAAAPGWHKQHPIHSGLGPSSCSSVCPCPSTLGTSTPSTFCNHSGVSCLPFLVMPGHGQAAEAPTTGVVLAFCKVLQCNKPLSSRC